MDAGWGLQGDSLALVMNSQVGGTLYVIFFPICSPLHHQQTPPPFLSFRITQSLHSTQGVVISGAAKTDQDKGPLLAHNVFMSRKQVKKKCDINNAKICAYEPVCNYAKGFYSLGIMSFLFDGTALAGLPDGKGRGRDRRSREGVRLECKLQTAIPACKKLDVIHMMLVGHEGCTNDSLLGIWKMKRERMSEV